MNSTKILGVKIDKVELLEATEIVAGWVAEKSARKRQIVTPNIEFIIDAQADTGFRKILNDADLSIPDSSRLAWLEKIESEKRPLFRLFIWSLFPFSGKLISAEFPITTGVDLMQGLSQMSAEKGCTIALLGGRNGVAERAAERLSKRFPKLKIQFAKEAGQVEKDGSTKDLAGIEMIHSDIVFIGLGHPKQDKFIDRYKSQIDAKVFMGVGGAFDYISGAIPRAPKPLRLLGLEWLFRLSLQPWRIKRQLRIAMFIFRLLLRRTQ